MIYRWYHPFIYLLVPLSLLLNGYGTKDLNRLNSLLEYEITEAFRKKDWEKEVL
jgi:hypothetical protein